MKKIAVALLSCVALADTASSAVWFDVDASQIQFVRADGRTGLVGYYIQFTQAFPGDVGCQARDFVYIRQSDPAAKEMYSTAIAAYLAGESLTIATTGCDSVGNIAQAVAIKRN